MVKQRFLTHFKPWFFLVSKAGALIVSYQLLDQARRHLQYASFAISDVLKAITIVLVVLAGFCGLRAWTEWCWFKLRAFRTVSGEIRRAVKAHRNRQAHRPAPSTRAMV